MIVESGPAYLSFVAKGPDSSSTTFCAFPSTLEGDFLTHCGALVYDTVT